MWVCKTHDMGCNLVLFDVLGGSGVARQELKPSQSDMFVVDVHGAWCEICCLDQCVRFI